MKKNLIRAVAFSTILALAAGLLLSNARETTVLHAETHNPHVENYNPYTYSGNYYSSVDASLTDGLHGTLRKKLSSLILPSAWYTYSGSSSGTLGSVLQTSDQDPLNSSNMILFYTRDSISKRAAGGNTTDWNREHVWPQALSNSHWQGDAGKLHAGADLLHIRPTWSTTNGNRGNTVYGDTNKANPQTYEGMLYAYTSGSRFEPLDSVKGDVARILMYVWTTYYEYYNDTSLTVLKAIESYDTLLKWHTMDKPDVLEGNRNNYAESSKQKNRNPFVDHPEYAWKIFGDQASAAVKQQCQQTYPDSPQNTIKKIELSGQPTKVEYQAGEAFDPTGLTVTATYEDNSTAVIANNQCTWEPKILRPGQTSVTCSYCGFTATYEGITVNAKPTPVIKGTYGIVFKENYEESNTPIASNEVLSSYTEVNSVVESVGNVQEVYPGVNGLKMAANSSIVFNLKDAAKTPNIKSIYFISKSYTSDVEVDVSLNEEEISFNSDEEIDNFDIAGYFDEGLSTITISTRQAFELLEFGIYVKENVDPQPSSSSSSEMESYGEESSSENSSSENNKKNARGCKGSIIGITSLAGISALVGLIFIFSKKKEQ